MRDRARVVALRAMQRAPPVQATMPDLRSASAPEPGRTDTFERHGAASVAGRRDMTAMASRRSIVADEGTRILMDQRQDLRGAG